MFLLATNLTVYKNIAANFPFYIKLFFWPSIIDCIYDKFFASVCVVQGVLVFMIVYYLKHKLICDKCFYFYERCEQLAEIIWKNRQQIKRVDLQRQQLPINNVGHDILPDLNVTITSLLSTLVTK